MQNEIISIIGLGRLGTYLFHQLNNRGVTLSSVIEKDHHKVKAYQDEHPNIPFSTRIKDIHSKTTLLIICVPDDSISKVSKELAGASKFNSRLLVLHTSGALTSDALSALQKKNVAVGSFHPCVSFTQDASSFNESITITIEGENKIQDRLEKMVKLLDAIPIRIKKEQKALYHAACVMASNFTVTLLSLAEEIMNHVQIERPAQVLMPLVQTTFQNVKDKGVFHALTGPVSRGDENTVRQHLDAIRQFLPHLLKPYILMSDLTLQLAARQLDKNRTQSIRDLLDTYQ